MKEKLVLLSKKFIPSFDTLDKLISNFGWESKIVEDITKRMGRDVFDEEILKTMPIYFYRYGCGEWVSSLSSQAFDIGGAVFRVGNVLFTLNRLFGPNKKPIYDVIENNEKLVIGIEGDIVRKKIKKRE